MANIFLTLDTSFSMSKTWIVSLFRGLFAFFDSLIYTLISWLFRAVFNLANFELYGVYEDMMDRVYVILGIFMLFKITVSLITYLADPDKINDKEQGISKLITRIITVMVMLIGLPTFFSLMTEAQNKILPVIPRIIINSPTTLSSDDVTGISEKLATTMLNGFAHVKKGCSNASISKPFDFLKVVNDSCESADDSNSDAYAYDYLPIVSTITGVIMIYVIFSFCISVAIRAFKLIILRSISPIPVLSYIDPKAEKDGGAFSTWKKTFFSTWLELFINLGLIYFIIYIIDMLLSGDMYKGFFDGVNFLDGVFLLAFLLIGLLMFARQAPQFIFDALGIKNKGNFTRMLGLGANAVGGVGAIRSAYRTRNQYDEDNNRGSHKLRNFGASLFSGAAAVNSGGNALLTAEKPTLRTGFDAQAKSNANMLSRLSSGSTLGGRLGAIGQTLLSGQTEIDKKEIVWKEEEEKIKYDKQRNAERKIIMDRASSKGLESLETSTDLSKLNGGSGFTGVSGRKYLFNANAAKFNSVYQAAVDRGEKDSFEFFDETNGKTFQIKMEDAKLLQHEINDGNIANYAEQALAGTITDTVITGADSRFASANNGVGVERVFGGQTGLKATYGTVNNNISEREMAIANDKNSAETKRLQSNKPSNGSGN